MLNIVSGVIGVIALLKLMPSLSGVFEWLPIEPFLLAVVGLGLGLLSARRLGRNVNLLALAIILFQLWRDGQLF